MTRINLNMGWS